MNVTALILYCFTWLLALFFFLLWRREQRERIYQTERGDKWKELAEKGKQSAEYYKHRFEVDESLLRDPELRFVGNCEGCAKVEDENGEPCKVLLSFDNIVKSNYCSQFKRKESHGSDLQTVTKPPISRSPRRYEGTLRRIEEKQGTSVGDGDQHHGETHEGHGNTRDND